MDVMVFIPPHPTLFFTTPLPPKKKQIKTFFRLTDGSSGQFSLRSTMLLSQGSYSILH